MSLGDLGIEDEGRGWSGDQQRGRDGDEDEDDDDGEDNERPRTSASTVRRSLNGGSTIIDGIVLSYTRRRSTARISLPLGLMFRKSIGQTSIASSLNS